MSTDSSSESPGPDISSLDWSQLDASVFEKLAGAGNDDYSAETGANYGQQSDEPYEEWVTRLKEGAIDWASDPHNVAAIPFFLKWFTFSPGNRNDRKFYTMVHYLYLYLEHGATRVGPQKFQLSQETLLSRKILPLLVELVLLDRWYEPNHESTGIMREALAELLACLTHILRYHQQREQFRYLGPPCSDTPGIEYARQELPKMFTRMWQSRHYLLPLPDEDEPKWELSKRRDFENCSQDQRLEQAVSYFVIDYRTVLAETANPPRNVLEGVIVQAHCMARTRNWSVWNIDVWDTVLQDHVLARALLRQINWRLREELIDRDLQALLGVVFSLAAWSPARPYPIEWYRMLFGVVRALERQKCMGMVTEGIVFGGLVQQGLGALKFLFAPSQADPCGFRGDISKLDLVGILAHLSKPALDSQLERTVADVLLELIKLHNTIVEGYLSAGAHNKLARLRRRASLSVPQALEAIRQVPTPNKVRVRKQKQDIINAWSRYVQLLDLDLERPDVSRMPHPPQRGTYRTCDNARCLCAGKRPGHRLHVCSRCYLVYYCSATCQFHDWEEGGHAEMCQLWRRRALKADNTT